MSPKKSVSNETPKKREQHTKPTGRFHVDGRVQAIMNTPEAVGDDDDMLTTAEEATWLKVSVQWLEIGRCKNYGPPFEVLGPGLIRYRRGGTREWLRQREFTHTAQYRQPRKPRDSVKAEA